MRVLFDTNIVLDVLLQRHPWVIESKAVWQASDEQRIAGYIAASTLTDVFYIARREVDLIIAHEAVRTCLEAFQICTVDRQTLEQAVSLPGSDFEDNLQIACATVAGLDAIVARDKTGFKAATISILSPAELLTQLS